jgi:hypothetical protein
MSTNTDEDDDLDLDDPKYDPPVYDDYEVVEHNSSLSAAQPARVPPPRDYQLAHSHWYAAFFPMPRPSAGWAEAPPFKWWYANVWPTLATNPTVMAAAAPPGAPDAPGPADPPPEG